MEQEKTELGPDEQVEGQTGDPGSENQAEKENTKKIKNLIAISILLAGLFVGSLFVDIGQLIKGGGFSQKNLDSSDVFEAYGKTWVAYKEPVVGVKVITDDSCKECDPGDVLVWLQRRVMPTISTEKIDYASEAGKSLIEKNEIKTLPAFIFDDKAVDTDFYSQAQVLFSKRGEGYLLDTQQLGAPPGKYLVSPQVNEGDATFGNPEAKVKVVIYSDFQCPYCKLVHKTFSGLMDEYKDKVLFDFKNYPLGIHAQANDAAGAALCALEQDKFWEYADVLFDKQADWGNKDAKTKFRSFAATLKLDTNKFNACLGNNRYQSKIDSDSKEAAEFGVSGTPAFFIGTQFKGGVASEDEIKKLIEEELAK